MTRRSCLGGGGIAWQQTNSGSRLDVKTWVKIHASEEQEAGGGEAGGIAPGVPVQVSQWPVGGTSAGGGTGHGRGNGVEHRLQRWQQWLGQWAVPKRLVWVLPGEDWRQRLGEIGQWSQPRSQPGPGAALPQLGTCLLWPALQGVARICY